MCLINLALRLQATNSGSHIRCMTMAKSLKPMSLAFEGGYSATPSEMTDPRLTYKISVLDEQLNDHAVLQKRMHIVLYYKNSRSDNDRVCHPVGWIKESLGKALVEEPILAGRIRRTNNGGLEIVTNDNGVRCVEAQTSLSLVEFLESKDKNEVEAELVYWKDVDETNPHFSPIFYVQVTNFQCGGYSVGISCSLLLADPLLMAKLLNTWAHIHRSNPYEGKFSKTPVFYTPNYKQLGCSQTSFSTTTSNPNRKSSKTAMFTISIDEKLNPRDKVSKNLVLQCIEEAESKLGSKMGQIFTLITKEPDGDVRVERYSKQSSFESPKSLRYEVSPLNWEDLTTNEIAFGRENVPIGVSQWVACDALEVVLVVISFLSEGKSGMNVLVTVPSKRD